MPDSRSASEIDAANAEEARLRASLPADKQLVSDGEGGWQIQGMASPDSRGTRFLQQALPIVVGAGMGMGAAGALGGVGGAAEGAAGGAAAGGGGSAGGAAAAMPAAIPETAATIGEWGLAESAPGVFTSGGGAGAGATGPAGGSTPEAAGVPPGPNPSEVAFETDIPGTELPSATGTSSAPPPSMPGTPAASGMPVGGAGADVPSGLVTEPPGTPQGAATTTPKPTLSDKALSAITNNPLAAGALGLNLAGQMQASSAQKKREEQMQKATGPAQDAAKQLIEQGMAGQVPPAIMAQFDRSLQDRVMEIKQRYSNMGRDAKTDSAAQNEISKAIAQKDAQVAAYAQQLVSQGLSAAGVAAGPQSAAIQAGAAQDHQLQQSMGATLQSMAMLEQLKARQNQPATTTPTTT